MAYGGDIKEITFNNDEVGSGTFKPKSAEGNTLDLGGFRTVDDANSVTTDGEMIVTINNKLGFFQILIANDANVRKDLEKVVQLAGVIPQTKWTVTLYNGKIYRGVGRVVGDITADLDKATVPLKVAVPKWEQV